MPADGSWILIKTTVETRLVDPPVNDTFKFFTLSNRFNPPGQQELHSHAGFTENLIATDGPPDGTRAEPGSAA